MSWANSIFEKAFRVTELISFISDQTLKILYRCKETQPKTVREWMGLDGRWARNIYFLCLTFSLFHFVVSVYPGHLGLVPKTSLPGAMSLLHALIILYAFIFVIIDRTPAKLDIKHSRLYSSKDEKNPDRINAERFLARAATAVSQFLKYWPTLWIFWFLLYLFLSTFYFIHDPEKAEKFWFLHPIFNAFNNGTAVIFFSMYYELSERTVDENKPKGIWMILLLFVILAGFAELVITALDMSNIENIKLAFSVLSGVITGVSTVLLTTRLASRILGLPSLAILVVVLYAVIQPLFPTVSNPKNLTEQIIGFLAVNFSLYGKATLLVLIHWMRDTHRLSYYMVRALQTLEEESLNRIVFLNEFLPEDLKPEKKPQSSDSKENH